MKDKWYYTNGQWKKATRWTEFQRFIHAWLTRFKIVDTWKYWLTLHDDSKYYFKLSPKEYEDAEKIYKDKGTISYEFYPAGGIAFGVRVHVVKTGETIDISDVESW